MPCGSNVLLGKKSNMERNVANIYSFTYLSLVKQGEYLRHQVGVFLPANENLIPEQNSQRKAAHIIDLEIISC